MDNLILISSGLTRLLGNICKIFCYIFHFFFPHKRFTIPKYSQAKIRSKSDTLIPKKIYQTNYTNRVTLPVYLNYLFNRLMSLDFDYYYASDDEIIELFEKNGTKEEFESFLKLTDGAAKADFWRLFVLNIKGGIYLDIDAQLVWPLNKIIKKDDKELIIKRREEYSNFFLASTPNHPILKKSIQRIVSNIKNKNIGNGVFDLTGPTVLNQVIGDEKINHKSNKLVCNQGSFTNEYFQYLDKKGGKWTHADKESLIKDD